MVSRRRNNKRNGKDSLKDVLTIGGLCLLVLLLIITFFNIGIKYSNKNAYAAEVNEISQNNEEIIFGIKKIVLFSSADASINEQGVNAFWNLNIHQYTDIAIYIDNTYMGEDFTNKNTIKQLYLDNITFKEFPSLGSPGLYYKDLNTFGTLSNLDSVEENKIKDRIDFNVLEASTPLDTSSANIYDTCNVPITLEYLNKNIKENYTISNTVGQLSFDGSLLKNSLVTIYSIRCIVSFDIHIINYLDEHYICNVSIDIPLDYADNEQMISIYDGNIKIEANDLVYQFFKKGD